MNYGTIRRHIDGEVLSGVQRPRMGTSEKSGSSKRRIYRGSAFRVSLAVRRYGIGGYQISPDAG
jgi:hypothetical protein